MADAPKRRRAAATAATVAEAAGQAHSALLRPLEAYIAPGRRKTDNPLVVGVIVLCLGVTAVTGIVQITATLWAGSQLRVLLDGQASRDKAVDEARARLFRSAEAQAMVLRRLCLNTARDEKERGECLTVAAPLSPEQPMKGH